MGPATRGACVRTCECVETREKISRVFAILGYLLVRLNLTAVILSSVYKVTGHARHSIGA